MANFEDHIKQANRNLIFLSTIKDSISDSLDWQVTVSFYVAVHLVNAHIAKKMNLHYRSHSDVISALNFANQLSPAKLGEKEYLAYIKLRNLSRMSRYLCSDYPNASDEVACFVKEKHVQKAFKSLACLMSYMEQSYKTVFHSLEKA